MEVNRQYRRLQENQSRLQAELQRFESQLALKDERSPGDVPQLLHKLGVVKVQEESWHIKNALADAALNGDVDESPEDPGLEIKARLQKLKQRSNQVYDELMECIRTTEDRIDSPTMNENFKTLERMLAQDYARSDRSGSEEMVMAANSLEACERENVAVEEEVLELAQEIEQKRATLVQLTEIEDREVQAKAKDKETCTSWTKYFGDVIDCVEETSGVAAVGYAHARSQDWSVKLVQTQTPGVPLDVRLKLSSLDPNEAEVPGSIVSLEAPGAPVPLQELEQEANLRSDPKRYVVLKLLAADQQIPWQEQEEPDAPMAVD